MSVKFLLSAYFIIITLITTFFRATSYKPVYKNEFVWYLVIQYINKY